MKILNKILSKFGKEKTVNDGWIDFTSLYGANYAGARNTDKYKSFAFACINARAENIAKARIYLYQKTGKGIDELTEHSFIRLINRPNGKRQNFQSLLFRIGISLDLYGDAYLFVVRNPSTREPVGLYHLPSKKVNPLMDSNLVTIQKYRYTAGTSVVEYPAEDVIHFSIPDPDNNIKGKATVDGFNFTLDVDYYQNLFQKSFYLNDASLGLLLETEKKMGDEAFKRLKKEIQEAYQGAGNAGKTLLLEDGLKGKPFTATPKDAQIVESRKTVRDEILAIMRTPKPILGISDDVNLANAREALRTFTDYVIKPFAKLHIESQLNIFIRDNYKENDLYIIMEYENDIDRELQLKTYDLYMKYNITTTDEVRELEGFETQNKK